MMSCIFCHNLSLFPSCVTEKFGFYWFCTWGNFELRSNSCFNPQMISSNHLNINSSHWYDMSCYCCTESSERISRTESNSHAISSQITVTKVFGRSLTFTSTRHSDRHSDQSQFFSGNIPDLRKLRGRLKVPLLWTSILCLSDEDRRSLFEAVSSHLETNYGHWQVRTVSTAYHYTFGLQLIRSTIDTNTTTHDTSAEHLTDGRTSLEYFAAFCLLFPNNRHQR